MLAIGLGLWWLDAKQRTAPAAEVKDVASASSASPAAVPTVEPETPPAPKDPRLQLIAVRESPGRPDLTRASIRDLDTHLVHVAGEGTELPGYEHLIVMEIQPDRVRLDDR